MTWGLIGLSVAGLLLLRRRRIILDVRTTHRLAKDQLIELTHRRARIEERLAAVPTNHAPSDAPNTLVRQDYERVLERIDATQEVISLSADRYDHLSKTTLSSLLKLPELDS